MRVCSRATQSEATLSTVTASLPTKSGQKKNRGAYSSVFLLPYIFLVLSLFSPPVLIDFTLYIVKNGSSS